MIYKWQQTPPEQLLSERFHLQHFHPGQREIIEHLVQRMRISMIVVDEAHCISTWGHDFRPHYRRIVTLLGALPASACPDRDRKSAC